MALELAIPMKKLVAIDGNSLLYRAFFAMRHLSTSDGTPTNAVYGLLMMLMKVLDEKPDYVAVAFDTPKPTFRHEAYDGYKAHRKAPPDELITQAPIARELIRAFNIPVIEIEGFEADDIIGALAKQSCEHGIRAEIVTGDLDALQLVNECVSVMTTIKGVTDIVIYGPKEVEARFGLKPDQMADFKGLKGDPSDNIPGVPGIGDKTAANLLQQYETVENLLEHLDELPEGKVKRTLQENTDTARLSKHLATIVTDLPFEFDLAAYSARQPDFGALRDLFVRLEFKTMLKRLPEVEQAVGAVPVAERPALGSCRRINSDEELRELIASLERAGEFAVQCHTLHGKSIRAQIIGIGFSAGADQTAYVEVLDPAQGALCLGLDESYRADLQQLVPLIGSENLLKYVHDAKRNIAALALRGVHIRGIAFDTMLGGYILDSSRSSYEIGDLAFEHLSLEMAGTTREEKDAEDFQTLCNEAEAIYRLKAPIEEKLRRDGEYDLYKEVELPLTAVLADMELNGVAVDVGQLEAISTAIESEVRDVEKQIYDIAGEEFNIGSPRQLQAILFEKLGLSSGKKTKTGYSTSAAALEQLAVDNPIVDLVLRYRELTKIKSTYADSLPKLINSYTGRVHTSLNQAVTATGRLSSSDPNLQNIPIRTELGRRIRRAFTASNNSLLLSADYSQIELRIFAHVTGDPGLSSAFEKDEDIHTHTASTIFGCPETDVTSEMRRRAKTVNFAVIYGMSDFALARSLGIPIQEAREYISTYFARFPGVLQHTEDTIQLAREQGFVSTPLGRRRYIPDIHNSNRNIRLFAERAAVNMPIQGMAADIMKIAMIRVARALADPSACDLPDDLLTGVSGFERSGNPETEVPAGVSGISFPKPLRTKMVLQVHDELLFEVPREELDLVSRIVRFCMEDAYHLNVPVKVDVKVGNNWAEMQEVSA